MKSHDTLKRGDKMKILNFGSCNIDYVYSVPHFVRKGETLHSSKLEVFPGGKGLNQSIAIARAGAEIYHAGCIGSDGEMLINTLLENGVDISHIKIMNEKSGHAIIQVTCDGENSIFLHSGSNIMITKEQIDKVLSCFSKGDILLLQNEINSIDYMIETAHKKQMTIILNPSPIDEKIINLDYSMLDYVILNEIEAQDISSEKDYDQVLKFFKEKYPNLKVMLTLGKNGCIYQDKNQKLFHPVFETNVMDTTAAGDTFTGYFVSGISKGLPVKEILKTASCAAAISISRMGASTSIPSFHEVQEKLNTFRIKSNNISIDSFLRKLDQCMDQNIAAITLEELSKELGYSTAYTSILIKKYTSLSYKDYLHKKRLEKAAGLLSDSMLSIAEIIKMCGYENASYFRKIFKEKYNTNPFDYRKRRMMRYGK